MAFFVFLKQKNVNKIHPRLYPNWRSKAKTTDDAYFITITTLGWIAIFTRLNQKYVNTKALNYCQEKRKGMGTECTRSIAN